MDNILWLSCVLSVGLTVLLYYAASRPKGKSNLTFVPLYPSFRVHACNLKVSGFLTNVVMYRKKISQLLLAKKGAVFV